MLWGTQVIIDIIVTQFSVYLEEHNLLHLHQGAYRCDNSTSDILTLAVDHIVQSIDTGQAVCVACLDLRKAFNSLDHGILLLRINDLSVSRQVLLWFQNYLTGCVQRVKVKDQHSNWGAMCDDIPHRGVPWACYCFCEFIAVASH